MNYCLAQKTDARQIAAIHKTEINQGFLSSLPASFLENLYEAMILSPESFCIVAKEGNEVIGFISGVTSTGAFYQYFLQHYFFTSFLMLLPKVFSSLKKIFETLLYPKKEQSLPRAELLTMAVSQKFQGQGIASAMLTEFKDEMKKRNIKECKVLVGTNLAPAIRFYEKSGFVFVKNISVHGSAVSKIYVYHF